jgi:hypothetical protein
MNDINSKENRMWKLSLHLRGTTEDAKGYGPNLKRTLTELLTKGEQGIYPWEAFQWGDNHGKPMGFDKYDRFEDYLENWSRYKTDDFHNLFVGDEEVISMLEEVGYPRRFLLIPADDLDAAVKKLEEHYGIPLNKGEEK